MANTTNLNLYVTDDQTVKVKDWISQMAATSDSNMVKIDTAYHTMSENLSTANTNIGNKQDKHTAITGTLAADGWSTSEGVISQTITANGVTATNTVIVSPAPSSINDYADAGIVCTTQAANSLTFTCETQPASAVTVNIVIFKV